MASSQLLLVLFYGELWKWLSVALPQNASRNKRNASTSTRGPRADKAPLYPLQATRPRSHRSGRALPTTTPPPFPKVYAEPSDGSWIAALLIGVILISMLMAIIIILLWKCCRRPVLVDSNWAGRSPLADGDTPDVFMDSDQATKRSSVLFMLPWKWKQDTDLQEHVTTSEKPPPCTTSNENSQLPPATKDCSGAGVSSTDASPAPTDEAASHAHDSCPPPVASPECLDLPPPPDWLREPAEDHSSDPSKCQELPSETEDQLPPPPQLLIQETHEPLPQLPQPQERLQTARTDSQHASHFS